jgi:flagellar biosynthesis GTPase FlhF
MNRSTRKQRGGAAAFPDVFGTTLDASLRASAGVDKIDAAFAQLPQFAGSYGTQTGPQVGGSRRNRKNRKNNAMRKNSRKNRKNSRKNNAMRKNSRKNRKNSRKNNAMRKNSRKNNAMRKNSRKNRKNNAMRKNSRKNRKNSRRQRGGAWVDQFASVDAPSNLLPKDMYPYSHQNPQFYNENVVNPNFNGPSNSYAM